MCSLIILLMHFLVLIIDLLTAIATIPSIHVYYLYFYIVRSVQLFLYSIKQLQKLDQNLVRFYLNEDWKINLALY